MLFGTIERKKCFFDGSLSPIAMKTYAQLLDDWKKADQDSWTKEYGVPRGNHGSLLAVLVTRLLHRQLHACPRA